jgi:hypothetical protein
LQQIVNCLRKQLILCSDTKIDAAEIEINRKLKR